MLVFWVYNQLRYEKKRIDIRIYTSVEGQTPCCVILDFEFAYQKIEDQKLIKVLSASTGIISTNDDILD